MQVTVVGAGIIGLTTALTLEEHGHEVRVVAAATGPQTTSAVAGAVWFPYRAGPAAPGRGMGRAHARAGSSSSRSDPATGIDVLTGYEITSDEGLHAAAPVVGGHTSTVARAPAPVTGAPLAWKFTAPRVEPSRFLPWLDGATARTDRAPHGRPISPPSPATS